MNIIKNILISLLLSSPLSESLSEKEKKLLKMTKSMIFEKKMFSRQNARLRKQLKFEKDKIETSIQELSKWNWWNQNDEF